MNLLVTVLCEGREISRTVIFAEDLPQEMLAIFAQSYVFDEISVVWTEEKPTA